MSEPSLYFYLPPGILKTDQLIGIFFNQGNEKFKKAEVKAGNVQIVLNNPTIVKDLWYWSTSDSQNTLTASSSTMEIKINNKSFKVNLDNLTIVSQTDDKLVKNELGPILLFKFKAGIFARKEDFEGGTVSIEKVTVLHNQKRVAYETACSKTLEVQQKFDELCKNGFQTLYDKYFEFDETRKMQRIDAYRAMEAEHMNMPVSKYLNPVTDEDMQKNLATQEARKQIQTFEPVSNDEDLEFLTKYPTKPNDVSPSTEEIQMFLKEIIPIFPVDVLNRTFCGIKETDPDLYTQRIFLFNVCHFLALYSVITGITFDYRMSVVEGSWRIEDRITGNEIKKETMTKANVFDNPYREAIVSSLKKAANDLKCKSSDNIVATIAEIQKYNPASSV